MEHMPVHIYWKSVRSVKYLTLIIHVLHYFDIMFNLWYVCLLHTLLVLLRTVPVSHCGHICVFFFICRRMTTGIWTSLLHMLHLILSTSRCGLVTTCTWKLSISSTSGLCRHLWQPHVSFSYLTTKVHNARVITDWITQVVTSANEWVFAECSRFRAVVFVITV